MLKTKILAALAILIITVGAVAATATTAGNSVEALSPTPCIITVDGKLYNVAPLKTTHPGGDVFVCGTDQSVLFHSMHGNDIARIAPYLVTTTSTSSVSSSTTTSSVTSTVPSSSSTSSVTSSMPSSSKTSSVSVTSSTPTSSSTSSITSSKSSSSFSTCSKDDDKEKRDKLNMIKDLITAIDNKENEVQKLQESLDELKVKLDALIKLQ